MTTGKALAEVLRVDEQIVLNEWLDAQFSDRTMRSELLSRSELQNQARRLLSALRDAIEAGGGDTAGPAYAEVRQLLGDLSGSRARQGYTPSETAAFIFSLKQPIFNRLRQRNSGTVEVLADVAWDISTVLDHLGIYTLEVYQKGREQIIVRQQEEMLELSTPVITLWKGILALPLIGTLDSSRTQVVMENLLQRIVDTGASLAIVDITGVPTVDTLTAQHLLKTVAAARLMGADCIISGIRPQIAQTIVHLGVELGDVITKASLADALALAFRRNGLAVQPVRNQPQEPRPGTAEAGEEE